MDIKKESKPFMVGILFIVLLSINLPLFPFSQKENKINALTYELYGGSKKKEAYGK